VIRGVSLSPYWDNASIPAAAARLFTEHEFGEPLAIWPAAVPLATVVAVGLLALTAYRVRRGGEGGLWALAAAALLVSPIAWHNYLVVLAPGALLLLARGRLALGALLVSLQTIPAQWPRLWAEGAESGAADPTLAALATSLYLPILLAHWAAFLALPEPTAGAPDDRLPGVRETPGTRETGGDGTLLARRAEERRGRVGDP
jgi:hypothetical protein